MKYILLLIVTCAFYSCTVDDNVIPAEPADKNYITYNQANSQISIYNATNKNFSDLSQETYSTIENSDSIALIKTFLKKSYIVFNSGNCLVIDNKSRSISSAIEIPASFDNFSDMVFPNASTAYISSGKGGKIAVIDIANNQFVKLIENSQSAAGMMYYANELYVCNPLEDKIDVYDTRTDELLRSKNTDKAPILIGYSPEEDLIAIVTAGTGKLEEGEKSSTKLNIYKREEMELREAVTIERGNINSNELLPFSIGINDMSFAIIATQEGIFRYNLRFANKIALINSVKYKNMVRDTYHDTFILQLSSDVVNQAHILSAKDLKVTTVIDFNRNIDYIYPLID